MKVVLGGEGPNDLGGWYHAPPYRPDEPDPGVIETLLRRVRADGWQVTDAIVWKKIRKYRAGAHADAEERDVLGLILAAREQGADVVAFIRDQDSQRDRGASFVAALLRAADIFPDGPAVIGGLAVRALEAWILALLGEHHSEDLGRDGVERALQRRGIPAKDTRSLVERAAAANLESLPTDATSLLRWLARAHDVLHGA